MEEELVLKQQGVRSLNEQPLFAPIFTIRNCAVSGFLLSENVKNDSKPQIIIPPFTRKISRDFFISPFLLPITLVADLDQTFNFVVPRSSFAFSDVSDTISFVCVLTCADAHMYCVEV